MRPTNIFIATVVASAFVSGSATAKEPKDDKKTEPAAPQAELVPENVTLPASDKASPSSDEKWIRRHAPINNQGELGAYGGVYLPSRDHELFEPNAARADGGYTDLSTAAGTVGARIGYMPLRFFGIEAEGGAAPTRTVDDERATLWHVRGSAVGQLGLWSVVPFVLAGAGALGVSSGTDALGNDVDATFHFGGGMKINANERLQIRLDLRDVLAARRGVADGVSHNGEILVGAAIRLGKRREPEPAPKKAEPVAAKPILDTDGDGFFDPDDKCPKVPGVDPDGCPKLDRDRDGFLDEVDACPEDPGIEPDGCPLRDRDSDGFLDPDDKCPDEPENRNGFEDTDGCPDELPEEIKAFSGVIEGIYFDVDRDTIRTRSLPVLNHAVEVLKKYPELRIEISGHTDATGGQAHNLDLSARRAASVKTYLVGSGIDEDRIVTRGAGPDEPIADNATKEGRQENRRIEFKVLEQ